MMKKHYGKGSICPFPTQGCSSQTFFHSGGQNPQTLKAFTGPAGFFFRIEPMPFSQLTIVVNLQYQLQMVALTRSLGMLIFKGPAQQKNEGQTVVQGKAQVCWIQQLMKRQN